MRLNHKVAVISGAARGMGAAQARLFAQEGAKVVIGDVLNLEGRRVEAEILEAGGQAAFVELDVRKEEDWIRAMEVAISQFGLPNVLVNNAGIAGSKEIDDFSQDWDGIMDVNCKGVMLGTKVVIPAMRKAGGGSIINISSQLGIVGADNSHPGYVASKGAVRNFTKAIALQYVKDNIRCNSVHPGQIDTPMGEEFLKADPGFRELQISRTPMGRYGRPEEVSYGVLYLASDESSFVTGAELVIDGGWLAQ